MSVKLPQVTIYRLGMFGLNATRARLVGHGRKNAAQYQDDPYVQYIPESKRKTRHYQCFDSDPFLVIVTGWDAPQAANSLADAGNGTQQTRHLSCDPLWREEADLLVDTFLKQYPDRLVVDYRKKPVS